MTETDCRIVEELGENIERFAGKAVRARVMKGSDVLTSSTEGEAVAHWLMGAMDRLDGQVDSSTRKRIMQCCGRNCSLEYQELIQFAKERRKESKSLDEFLEREQRNPPPGMRLERVGGVLYMVYDPASFAKPSRCYCCLLMGLHPDEKVSLTYCHCAEGFIKSYWEEVLGTSLRVRILESTVSGGKECRFAIQLPGGCEEVSRGK